MIQGWQGWLFLAWGLFVPGIVILIIVWYGIKHKK